MASDRVKHPGFVPRLYPDGTTDCFCLDCAEPCEPHVYRARGWPEFPYGVVVESRCCQAPVVDADGMELEYRDF